MRYKYIAILFLLACVNTFAQSNKYKAALAIDKIMANYTNENEPGASVLVLKNNKVIFKKGYGVTDINSMQPIKSNTNFRLASVTKQFTAMSILMLEKKRKLSLEDSLSKYFSILPPYISKIKIKDLLTHSSGLIDYEDLMPVSQVTPLHDTNCLQLMFFADSLYFPAGTEYKYSNTGYAILALIVEQVSGKPFSQFVKENIFKPLGMKTTVAFEEGKNTVANRAYGHSFENGNWKQTDQSLTSAVLGDGGIYTNVQEYTKWIKALWNYKLLPETTQLRAWSKTQLNNGKTIDYGYGWHVEDFLNITHPFHDGSSIGFRNSVGLFPEQKLMVIILTNRNEHDPIEEVHKIAALYLEP
jgi:CubicO group peptidase (beta-lactamase class C family)